jgi:hypothetical protein
MNNPNDKANIRGQEPPPLPSGAKAGAGFRDQIVMNFSQLKRDPKGWFLALPPWQQVLASGTGVIGLLIAAAVAAPLALAPHEDIGAAIGLSTPLRIRNCEASWLNRKVVALKERCFRGNIDTLKVREDEVFRQYVDLATQWPQIYLNGDYTSSNIAEEVKQLMWPEENALRRTVNSLIGVDDLRSLTSAQNLYLARLNEISRFAVDLQKRIDLRKDRAQAEASRAPQASPYSILPDPNRATITVPVIGKSGPFNVYAIEPKDNLDALHYFIGNDRVEPDLLVGMLPVIEKATAQQQGLKCEFLCADAQGNIVGRKRVYVDDHPAK